MKITGHPIEKHGNSIFTKKKIVVIFFKAPLPDQRPKILRGPDFGSQKWWVSADQSRRTCTTQGVSEGGYGPLRSWGFFLNVVLNDVIWCTIFHLTAFNSMSTGMSFPLEQGSQKSGGVMAPVWKVEGPLVLPLWLQHHWNFSRPNSFEVMDQNSENDVWINNSRTAWPT